MNNIERLESLEPTVNRILEKRPADEYNNKIKKEMLVDTEEYKRLVTQSKLNPHVVKGIANNEAYQTMFKKIISLQEEGNYQDLKESGNMIKSLDLDAQAAFYLYEKRYYEDIIFGQKFVSDLEDF